MRVELWQPTVRSYIPGEGESIERSAQDAFDNMVGETVPLRYEGMDFGTATVVAVKVDEDGTRALWTLDLSLETERAQ